MTTLATYLNRVTPVVNETLSVASSDGVVEQWVKNQEHISMESLAPVTITHDDDNVFYIQLAWDLLTETDMRIIIDFFENSLKGNGIANTFKWFHPIDENFYTVRFTSPKMIKEYDCITYVIQTVTLKIIGYAELASDYAYDSVIRLTSDHVVSAAPSTDMSFVDRTGNSFVDRTGNAFIDR